MSATGVSLNLRTAPKIKGKNKGQYSREQIKQLQESPPGCCDKDCFSSVREAETLENQLARVRELFSPLTLCDFHLNTCVTLFFTLPSNSSVRKLLASCLSKVSFDVSPVPSEAFSSYLLSPENRAGLSENLLRCFETCQVARKAALAHFVDHTEALLVQTKDLLESGQLSALHVASTARALLGFKGEVLPEEVESRKVSVLLAVLKGRPELPIDTKLNLVLCILQQGLVNESISAKKLFLVLSGEAIENDPLSQVWSLESERVTVCQALLVALSDTQLCYLEESNQSVARTIFGAIDEASENLHDQSLILLNTRAVQQLALRIESLSRSDSSSLGLASVRAALVDVCFCVEKYTGTFIDCSIDSVKHNIKNTLYSTYTALKRLDVQALDEAVIRVLSQAWTIKSKYISLQALAKSAGCAILTGKEPNLPFSLLENLSDLTIAGHCSELYKICLKASCLEEEKDKTRWLRLWVKPVLQSRAPECKGILAGAIKLHSSVLDFVLGSQGGDGGHVTNSLLAIKYMKEQRNGWKEYLQQENLGRAFQDWDDSVRLEAFSCILVSRSSAETFLAEELEIILRETENNLCLEMAADRQNFQALFKKMLLRFTESATSSKRKKQSEEDRENLLKTYSDFMKKLIALLLSSLNEDSNSLRQTAALDCLVLYRTICKDDFTLFTTSDSVEVLEPYLEDCFEKNQDMALSLLDQYPPEALGYEDPVEVETYWQKCLEEASSLTPSSTAGAAYKMLFLSKSKGSAKVLNCKPEGTKVAMVLALMNVLKENVECLDQVDPAKPLYGILQAMRKILSSFERGSEELGELNSFSEDVLAVASTIRTLTSVILDSDSPEGLTFDNVAFSAQAVLLCAWRASKELSLLLSTMVQLLPMTKLGKSSLLEANQVEKIVHYFTDLLATTTHRGAFEQAFAGFTQVSFFLWNTEEPTLRQMVDKLLDDTLNAIANKEFCSTRRSAGIPFLIQALIASEPVSSKSKPHLDKTMRSLLSAANGENESVRIQAYNILRALFRNNRLGSDIGSYAEQGVKITIQGFKAANWGERNAASLLFSALVTRIFGVKRDQDEFSLKNLMTTRMFFQSFPSLFPVLLEELEGAAEVIGARKSFLSPKEASLYPVLILLAKLRPSPVSTGANEHDEAM